MVSMGHGRAQIQYVEMGFRRDGAITGMHTRIIGDSGAYGALGGLTPMATTRTCGQGPYAIPRMAWDVAVAVTNTTPTGADRGAGRPEAAAQLERILDIAADDLGIDPVEIRRRNFLRPEDFPATSLTGALYDSGEYEKALDEAVRLADYDDVRRRQAEQRRNGDRRVLGIGISSYVEASAPAIADFGTEFAGIEVHPDGTATLRVGTSGHGQGHATSFAMVTADRLGIPIGQIRFVQADTAVVPRGGGTVGSRSGQLAGSAVFQAAGMLMDRARRLAAEYFEAAPEDITVVGEGRIGVVGSPDHSLTWSQVVRLAEEENTELRVEHIFDQGAASFPFGTHVSIVEVDTETGLVTLLRHIAVDDCGVQINPMIVEGQVHGGVASGIAQALYEHFEYSDDGVPLTVTLMDYKMPSAAELPSFEIGHSVTPSPLNPLGAKGVGESGTTGSTAAVQNAVIDALSHLGVRHIDLPCTPERVWRAMQKARRGDSGNTWLDPESLFSSVPLS
jgi:carbon-monoxide dehydrogenase large subunit